MNAIHRRPPSTARAALNRLSPNQRLLVTAMRQWAQGPARMPDVAQHLFALFGIYYIEAAIEAFETLMTGLANNPSHPMSLFAEGCAEVSADELTVLKIVSAFQANEWSRAKAFAQELAEPEQVPEVLGAASFMAETLEARRILFTLREYKPLALMTVAGRG